MLSLYKVLLYNNKKRLSKAVVVCGTLEHITNSFVNFTINKVPSTCNTRSTACSVAIAFQIDRLN